jgi:hypothetical protein
MMRTLVAVLVAVVACKGTDKPAAHDKPRITIPPGPPAVLAPESDTQFPSTEPLVHTSGGGGFTGGSIVPTVAVWNTGIVRFAGAGCLRKATLPPARLYELISALEYIDKQPSPRNGPGCADAIYRDITIGKVTLHDPGCGEKDRGYEEATAMLAQVVGANPCPGQ